MGLVEILNRIPLKAASKLVEKTGVSKYTYAQACNFTGALPAFWCAIEGYQNGSAVAMIAGGSFAAINLLYLVYNPARRASEKLDYLENAIAEEERRHPSIDKEALKESLELKLARAKLFDNKLQASGLFQTLTGVGLGVLAAMAYFSSSNEANDELAQHAVYAVTAGLSSLLMGISHYFRAVKPSQSKSITE